VTLMPHLERYRFHRARVDHADQPTHLGHQLQVMVEEIVLYQVRDARVRGYRDRLSAHDAGDRHGTERLARNRLPVGARGRSAYKQSDQEVPHPADQIALE
jgi:hypothetical protein